MNIEHKIFWDNLSLSNKEKDLIESYDEGQKWAINSNISDLEIACEHWVFIKNGLRWSNNDNTAGDNYSKFKEGALSILKN